MSSTRVRMSTFVASAALGAAVLPGLAPAQAAPVATAPGESVQAHAAAKAPKKCRARLASVKKKVKGSTFASCILKAQKRAGTAVVRTAYDDGTSAKGPYRFRSRTTDASITQNDGGRLVVIGKSTWVKQPGDAWVKSSATSSDPRARSAYVAGVLWRATANDKQYKKLMRSTNWKPTGKVKRIKGVKTRQYTGTPKHPDGKYLSYAVWLDSSYRPARVTSTMEVMGYRTKMTQNYTRWGKKVSIKAPAM